MDSFVCLETSQVSLYKNIVHVNSYACLLFLGVHAQISGSINPLVELYTDLFGVSGFVLFL